ncbi:phosphoribosylamine--glycine ligase [Patescibacteria group bacterium]|nr:phosphoribosylamine--glycine ligase [Patescibacteria group bacterium]MBU4458833.1 phosphoribosylamine--glycine ligase [Patescibacteria group bacterium]MCG2696234.1 phosphoribosylamine--glycine ligase [Candidatus Portnoybacteria bacterium]
MNNLNNEKTKKDFTPKNFLFVSFESLSGDLAWKIKNEGHEVKIYIKSEGDKDVYEGFLEKVDNWQEYKDWADVIVFDDVGFGNIADSLRKEGKLVVGGSKYTDKLEEDREFGQDEIKKAGLSILPHWDFTDFNSAIEFIKSNPGRYVFKPSGFISSDLKGVLFLGQEDDGKDLIEILEQNKKAWAKKIKTFQIQKMAVGVEVAVGAFFNGEDFIYPININFEHKKLFPGDIGPYTGEMGTLMYWSEPNEIFNMTLAKIKEELRKSGYIGYVDLNCIANQKGIFPLEFTCRFGYPTISIQMEGITSEMGEFLYTIAKKEKFELKTKKGFQVGIVVAVPPYPYEDKNETFIYRDLSILFRKPNLDGVHLGDVKLINNVWCVAGETGYVLIVTGSGNTVEETRKQAYNRIKNIMLQNMYYRTDIGLKWYQDSDKLQTWGYFK